MLARFNSTPCRQCVYLCVCARDRKTNRKSVKKERETRIEKKESTVRYKRSFPRVWMVHYVDIFQINTQLGILLLEENDVQSMKTMKAADLTLLNFTLTDVRLYLHLSKLTWKLIWACLNRLVLIDFKSNTIKNWLETSLFSLDWRLKRVANLRLGQTCTWHQLALIESKNNKTWAWFWVGSVDLRLNKKQPWLRLTSVWSWTCLRWDSPWFKT